MPCGMASPGCGSSTRPRFLMAEPRTQRGAPGALLTVGSRGTEPRWPPSSWGPEELLLEP